MADMELVESLFQSIDTIINKRIESLPYDKTVIATIEDNEDADYGTYVVNDGSTTFTAYSENTTYNIGDQVYVNIPQGDYNEQKVIIGQYSSDDGGTPIGYVDPMSTFLDITGNIYENVIDNYSLTANGELKETKTIWGWKADDNNNPFVGFDILGLQADFTSSVGRAQTILTGNYGLRLDIIAVKKSTQVYNKENKIYYSFKLDSDSFYGDPYNFETYYKQASTLNLTDRDIDRIDAMRLVFYQDSNFTNGDNELISADVATPNLGVSNIVIKLGYSLDKYEEDTVILYTFDPKTYVNQITDNIKQKYKDQNIEKMNQTQINNIIKEVNRKKLHCRWIHFEDNGTVECFGKDGSTTLPVGAELKWYRYHIVEQTTEQYDEPPGVFWEEVKTNRDKFDLTMNPDFTEYHEVFKIVLKNPGEEGLQTILNDDDDYLEADRYYKAYLNISYNFDPLDFLDKVYNDEKYYAWYINKAVTQAKTTLGNKEVLNNIQTAYNNKDYKKVASIYDDLYASSAADDEPILTCIIQKQVNFLKNWMTSFKTYQLHSTESFTDIRTAINADYQAMQNFIENNYYQLSLFNILDNDWTSYCLPHIQSLMQAYANENNLQLISYNIDISAYNTLINRFDRVLNEINKDANTRNYYTLKNEFSLIQNIIEDQAEEYYMRWYGTDNETGDQQNEPQDIWLNSDFPAQQKKYEQVEFYEYCQTIYQQYETVKDDIETTVRGEGTCITSNALEFLNEDPDVALVKLQTIKNLKLEVDTVGNNGVYLLYNDDGTIINKSEALTNRKITAKYTTFLTGDERIDTAEKIVWKFPKISTMIQLPVEEREYSLYDTASNVTAESFPYGKYYTKNFNSGYVLATTYDSAASYFTRNNTEVTEDNDYLYITKYAPLRDKTAYGTEEASSTEIAFRIKDFYVPSARNNTIYCEITKNNKNLMAESTLTFGTKGVIGTDYTFILQLEGNADHIPFQGRAMNVITKLYDYEGKDISDQIGTINFSWDSMGNGGLTLSSNSRTATITTTSGVTDISKCAHYILKAQISNGVVLHGKNEENDVSNGMNSEQDFYVKLVAYLPIVVQQENISHTERINNSNYVFVNNISRYEGASSIIYETSGINPTYYKDPFQLWYWDDKNRQSRTFQNLQWSIVYGVDCYEGNQIDLRYYPSMNNLNALVVPAMYLENNGKQISVAAKLNNKIIFLMPLKVTVRAYSSALLNSWNGGLTLDKENGTIMSAMMGAGYKDDSNRFYGILMGRMLQVNGERDLTNDYYTGTGIYGYNQGQKSFGLNINGKAFFGRSGSGQILFDGNTGEIISGNYEKPPISGHPEGTKIDLDDGTIDIRGKYNSSLNTYANIYLSAGNTNADYFRIRSDTGVDLLRISSSSFGDTGRFILKSNNFTQSGNGAGVKFDLENGKLIGYDFNLKAIQATGDYAGSYININSNGAPFMNIYYKHKSMTNGVNLFYASPNALSLRSPDYNSGSGMLIDVANGYIIAHDFTLSAGELQLSSSSPYMLIDSMFYAGDDTVWLRSPDGEGLYINAAEGLINCHGDFELYAEGSEGGSILLSSDPAFEIFTADGKMLISIDSKDFILSGGNKELGGEIDFSSGQADIRLWGKGYYYDENNNLVESKGGGILTLSAEDEYAIQVGSKLNVYWDGSIECKNVIAQEGGKIGPFTFTKNSIYTGAGDFGDGGIYIGRKGISLGKWSGDDAAFQVDKDGKMEVRKAKITAATITNASITSGTIDNASISNGSITDASISNLTLGGHTVNGHTSSDFFTGVSVTNTMSLLSSATELTSTVVNDRSASVTWKEPTTGNIEISSSKFKLTGKTETYKGTCSVTLADNTTASGSCSIDLWIPDDVSFSGKAPSTVVTGVSKPTVKYSTSTYSLDKKTATVATNLSFTTGHLYYLGTETGSGTGTTVTLSSTSS